MKICCSKAKRLASRGDTGARTADPSPWATEGVLASGNTARGGDPGQIDEGSVSRTKTAAQTCDLRNTSTKRKSETPSGPSSRTRRKLDNSTLRRSPRLISVFEKYPLSENEIRVLLLEPAADVQAPIHGSLEVTSIRISSRYEALSYTWGAPVRRVTLPDESIRLCGNATAVRGNLFDALKRLRFHRRQRRIWVDALCVNQSDHAERSQQVSMMARIYRQATRVQVWLGEDHGDADLAIAFLERVCECRTELEALRKDGSMDELIDNTKRVLLKSGTRLAKAVNSMFDTAESRSHVALQSAAWAFVREKVGLFMRRTYFTRRWILQEILHARETELRCGRERTTWAMLWNTYNFSNTQAGRGLSQIIYVTCPALQLSESFRHGGVSGIEDLLRLLDRVNSAECEDPRDRIFALLGLFRKPPFPPDYALGLPSTWIQVAKACINTGQVRSIISTAACQTSIGGLATRAKELPSWVPDFANTREYKYVLDDASMAQFDAHVDDQNRLTCWLSCLGEVIMINGWALLRQKLTETILAQVKAAPAGTMNGLLPDRGPERWKYSETRPAVPQRLEAAVGILPGDLVCEGPYQCDVPFLVRRVAAVRTRTVDQQQDYRVIGNVRSDYWPAYRPLTGTMCQMRLV